MAVKRYGLHRPYIAEIRELMALQHAVDEYKDNVTPRTKLSVKKVEEAENEPEVVVSGTDVYKRIYW